MGVIVRRQQRQLDCGAVYLGDIWEKPYIMDYFRPYDIEHHSY